MLSNHCNVTGLLRQLQVDIQVFKIIKQNGDVFKNWLCPNFLSVPKKSELPKIWGGCSPPRPPRPVRLCQQRLMEGTPVRQNRPGNEPDPLETFPAQRGT